MHGGIPLFHGGTHEHAVAHHAGVVHDDIERAEGVDGRADDVGGAVPIGNVIAIGHGLATGRANLIDHRLRRRQIAAHAGQAGAQVVHHHLRTFGGKGQRIGTAQAAAGAGDDDYTSVTDTHR